MQVPVTLPHYATGTLLVVTAMTCFQEYQSGVQVVELRRVGICNHSKGNY